MKNNKYMFAFVMLWSQIKLTSYDFTDLHITGEFANRPGTGRFLRFFSCVVTYRTGAGRRLIWLHRPMPGRATYGVVKDQPDTVRCPADFTRIFRCNGEFIYIKICHQCVKIKKIKAYFDIDGDGNHTCSRLQKIQ